MRNKWLVPCLFTATVVCLLNACQSEEEINYSRYYTAGKQVYENKCANCHNQDGSGLALLYPPLTDSTYLKQNKDKLACMIKHGLQGEIIIAGKTYDGVMPAQQDLTDIELAELITYLTNSFGNNQGLTRMEDVSKALKNCN